MKHRLVKSGITFFGAILFFSTGLKAQKPASDREYWAKVLFRIANPVTENMAAGTLTKNMPLETAPGYGLKVRQVTYLEAVGRTLAGLAPWLALPDDSTPESAMRKKLRTDVLKGLPNLVTPGHPDCLNFATEYQPLVDAAFLAHAFLRAPGAFWEPLDFTTKHRYIAAFQSLRDRRAFYNNWLLFSGITEAFLLKVGAAYDPLRMDLAFRKMKEWYVGDGWYADGEKFAMDYYNSYVIHSMLVDMLKVMVEKTSLVNKDDLELAVRRMVRFAESQERMISPEGSFPVIGRSLTYRLGAFQSLAQVALEHRLPNAISPAQVRCALTAVMKRLFEPPGSFDKNGWLQLGFAGHQPEIADTYTSTGSLYLTTTGFLPLGLPANDPFWTDPPQPWTAQKAFAGQEVKKDYKVTY